MSDDPLDLDTGLPARIAADAAVLAPLTLSVARRLPASADTDGVMRPDHQALARELGVDVAAIKDALEQLRRRGHLTAEPGRDLRMRIKRKSTSAVPGDAGQLDLFANAVPATRPRDLVGYRFAPEPSSTRACRARPQIVPFPRRHDHGFVERQAARMGNLSRSGAAKYLRHMLQAHAIELRARGVAEELIEREIDMLSAAIKAAASFRSLLTPDDKEPA
jgi:DNA-binding transcriptional MocR family regulator